MIEPLLVVQRVLRKQIAILHHRLLTSGETRQSGKFSMSSLMRASNLTAPTTPTLRPKFRQSCAQVIVNGNGLRLQQLAVGE